MPEVVLYEVSNSSLPFVEDAVKCLVQQLLLDDLPRKGLCYLLSPFLCVGVHIHERVEEVIVKTFKHICRLFNLLHQVCISEIVHDILRLLRKFLTLGYHFLNESIQTVNITSMCHFVGIAFLPVGKPFLEVVTKYQAVYQILYHDTGDFLLP